MGQVGSVRNVLKNCFVWLSLKSCGMIKNAIKVGIKSEKTSICVGSVYKSQEKRSWVSALIFKGKGLVYDLVSIYVVQVSYPVDRF